MRVKNFLIPAAFLVMLTCASAPAAASDLPAGIYNGTYTCVQGPTKVDITINPQGNSGQFAFETKSGLKGSYSIAVVPESGAYVLRPVQWEQRPPNFTMVPVRVQLTGDVLSGTVQAQGCGRITTRRLTATQTSARPAVGASAAGAPSSGGPSKVVVPGSACTDGGCQAAPPSVYECIGSQLIPNPVTHGRLVRAMRDVERDPTWDGAQSFMTLVERTSCGAKNYRLRLSDLHAVTDRTVFLGRPVTITGLLMKDLNGNVRVQLPDGSYPWILVPATVNLALLGSPVRVDGVTAGPQSLKVTSMAAVAATAALMTPASKEQFIWCQTPPFEGETTYVSAVFGGSSSKTRDYGAAFKDAVFRTYGARFTATASCSAETYIDAASRERRYAVARSVSAKRKVVETDWRYLQ